MSQLPRILVLALFVHGSALAQVPAAPLVIEGVDVLDLERETLIPDRNLVVSGGRIASVTPRGEAAAPAGAVRIDGRGLVAVPGLHDMHVHVESAAFVTAFGMPSTPIDFEAALFSYLANGVTTIQVCSGAPDLVELRNAITAGELLGPRLVVGSPMLAGSPPILPPPITQVVSTREEAVQAVRDIQESGYDFIKLRESIPADAFFALAEEARRRGIRVAGHVPVGEDLSLEKVLGTGGYGVLHLDGLIGAEPQSREQVEAVARLVRAGGGEVVTTLTVMANLIDKLRDYDATLAQPEMRYMHPLLKGLWHNNPFREPSTPERLATMADWLANQQRLLVELVSHGVTVMAGTDALNPTIVPGFSIHGELRLMVDAGLTPLQALRTATTVPARFLASDQRAGRIAAGAPADFVLVGRSPLEDLDTLRRPAGVVVQGRWLPADEIESRLEAAAASFASAPTTGEDARSARLDELVRGRYPADQPGAAVLVRRGDRPLLRRGYGLANVEHGVPVRPESSFRIASVTKTLTAYAAIELVERDLLGLATRVGDVLAAAPEPMASITVAQLLRHESGLGEIYDVMVEHGLEDLSPVELARLFWDRPLATPPGTERRYSNGNYVVLGAMLEAITSSSYAALMKDLVFDPLSMTRTGMPDAGEIVPDRAAGYTRAPSGELRNAPYFSPVLSSAAGALVATVDDLERFGRALDHDWGWQPVTVEGHPAFEHGGSSIGWVAAVLRVPAQEIFVAVLSNRGFDREPTDLARQLAALALADPGPRP